SLKSAEAELARKVRFTADAASLGSDYSLIVVANVFHHIEPAQRKATFAALRKLLALGGRLVVFEHNPFNPATQWIVDRCAFDENAVLLPSSETIDGMKAAGLTPERRDFISFVPGFLAPLQPLERFLGWCPAGAQYAAVGRRVD
ncbi:MAG: class I SAM-dependent methyltransferase, partial [Elusimicrobia bacterium]|nr:class I SAM-dependent methyltransferase [Elusimicrobiota bacterium]